VAVETSRGMEGSVDALNETSAFPPGRSGSSVAGYGSRKAEGGTTALR
jgi:hypothetical protein